MDRITKQFLQAQVDHINRITGSPMQPYSSSLIFAEDAPALEVIRAALDKVQS